MTKNFPNLVKEKDTQIQEAQSPKRDETKEAHTNMHHKMPKVKTERFLKAAREEQLVIYQGAPIRLSADFSTETLQARRQQLEIFKVMKNKDLKPRLLYKAKLSFRSEGQIKSFPDQKNRAKEVHHHQTCITRNVRVFL